jgi:Protein of unknown function (DUF742)
VNGAQRPGSQSNGRVVPIFAMTGGRTRSTDRDLPIESLVTATDRGCIGLEPEYRAIVGIATRPVSLVEIGATLGVPVGVARVLVADLADSGHLVLHAPPPTFDGNPTPAILTRLLEGLRAR